MAEDYNYRFKQWTPPPRPEWVQRVNEEGRCLDLKSVVPLDENSLIERAKANTGLEDFGQDDWYEPFQVFIKSLDEEANLNLMGRLMTRSDLLMHLEARLRIQDTYKRHPEIEEEEIKAPILIVGSGRSGTSALQNLLAWDPDNSTPKHWEALFPVPPDEEGFDPRLVADRRMTQWNRVTPEIESMHEFGGDMPTELIQIETMTFQSTAWLILYGFVPSYLAYMEGRSMLPALNYDKKVLRLLQWQNPRKRWLLKSPDSMRYLPDVLQVFPDVNLVLTHRDPLKAVSSGVNLVRTLSWVRSDTPLSDNVARNVTDPVAMAEMFNNVIDWMEQGRVPKDQVVNVQYVDFVNDPLATARSIYQETGISMTDRAREAMEAYMRENPRESRPAHKYNTGKSDLRAEERQLFRRYQDYFNVPNEV